MENKETIDARKKSYALFEKEPKDNCSHSRETPSAEQDRPSSRKYAERICLSGSAKLVATAKDSSGKLYRIEIMNLSPTTMPQNEKSCLAAEDLNSLKDDDSHEDSADVYRIFLTDGDYIGSGETITKFTSESQNNQESLGSTNILFVNKRCDSDDDLGRMLRSMMESDIDKIEDEVIRDALSLVKEDSDLQISIYEKMLQLEKEKKERNSPL